MRSLGTLLVVEIIMSVVAANAPVQHAGFPAVPPPVQVRKMVMGIMMVVVAMGWWWWLWCG